MRASPPQASFCALFLPAPSPGQLIRYLERRQRAAADGEQMPTGLLLSDPAGPKRLRALVTEDNARDYMERAGPAYAAAFSGSVTLLWRVIDRGERDWGFASWDKTGVETERGETAVPASGGGPTFPNMSAALARFAEIAGGGSSGRPLPPEAIWARHRGFPIDRIPAFRPPRAPIVPTLDYETVARLDQKSLLVEYGPRWYRFGDAPGEKSLLI